MSVKWIYINVCNGRFVMLMELVFNLQSEIHEEGKLQQNNINVN